MALFKFRRNKSPSPEEQSNALRDSIQTKLANYVPDSPVEDIQVEECDLSDMEAHFNEFVNISVTMAWRNKATFPDFAKDAMVGGFAFGKEDVELNAEVISELSFLRTLCIDQFSTKPQRGSPWGNAPDGKHFRKTKGSPFC